ncbi:hypothetical protein ACT3SZ_02325 [Corynebacterium sp. AOP40-9SA-29]|uniref:hypothetical protein n=1 Tax=Corynebacterium sp. AOP40-9SA-29 TaxID=3457677 RepID=UPI004034F0B3
MENMTEYTATVSPDGTGWMVHVPDLDRVTYAPHLRDVEGMAVDLIEIMTGAGADEITLDIAWPAEILVELQSLDSARRAAGEAQENLTSTLRSTVSRLHERGTSYRDIGSLLGLSHQRVAQISAGR